MTGYSARSFALERLTNVITPVAALIFCGVYVGVTYDLPAESRVFPYTAAAVVTVFGLVLLLQELRPVPARVAEAGSTGRAEGSKAPLVFALSVGFVVLFWLVDFAAASFVYLLVAQLLLRQPLLKSALIAAGVTAGLYTLFAVLLGVQL